jgi:hypothetical protein
MVAFNYLLQLTYFGVALEPSTASMDWYICGTYLKHTAFNRHPMSVSRGKIIAEVAGDSDKYYNRTLS